MKRFFKLKDARDYAEKQKYEFLFTIDWYYLQHNRYIPIYAVTKSYETFLVWYRKRTKFGPANGVCEMTFPDQPLKAMVDIDIKELDTEMKSNEPVLRVIQAVKARLLELNLVTPDWEPKYAVASGSRWIGENNFKYSAHIIFQNLSANSRSSLLHFMDPLCKDDEIIDRSIYASKKSQAFRFIKSYKWDDKRKTPLRPVKEWSTVEKLEDSHFIVSNPTQESILLTTRFSKTKKRKRTTTTTRLQKHGESIQQHTDDAILRELQIRFLHHKIEWREEEEDYYIYTPQDGRTCCVTKTHHKNNNASAKVDDVGNVWYRCYSQKCQQNKLFLFNVNINMKKGKAVWRKDVDVVTVHETTRVREYRFKPHQKCMVVLAGMGMGKTYQLAKYLQTHSPKRILLVTSRIQLANTLKGLFPKFELYTDNLAANWQIVNYESLHKIRADTPFDLVVSDEFRSTCDNVTSVKTNRRFIQDNATAMQFYMQTANRTIVMDADCEVDCMASDVLHGIFKDNEVVVERYSDQTLVRSLQIMPTFDWWNEFEKDVSDGLKLGVPCRTKKDANTIAAKLKSADVSYKIYTSAEDDVTMKDFRNLDEAWKDVQVVIFSSKVTVGADCQLLFDRIYIHAASYGGCNARNILQMQGRWRQIKYKTIRICVKESKSPEFPTYEQSLHFYDERRKSMKDAISGYIRFKPEFSEYGQVWSPDHVTAAFAHSKTENDTDFVIDLFTKASDKGYNVLDARIQKKKTKEEEKKCKDMIKNLEQQVKEDDEIQRKCMFGEMKDTYLDLVQEADKRVRTQQGNTRDRMVCEMEAVLKHFPKIEGMDYQTYDTLQKHMSEIKNICAVHRNILPDGKVDTVSLMSDELKRLSNKPWAEFSPFQMFTTIYKKLGIVLYTLGLDTFFDENTEVANQKLKDHQELIRDSCKEISKLRGVEKCRKMKGQDEVKITKTMLNRELKAMFAVTLKCKQTWIGERKNRKRGPPVWKLEKMVIVKKDEDSNKKKISIHDWAAKSDFFINWEMTAPVIISTFPERYTGPKRQRREIAVS